MHSLVSTPYFSSLDLVCRSSLDQEASLVLSKKPVYTLIQFEMSLAMFYIFLNKVLLLIDFS